MGQCTLKSIFQRNELALKCAGQEVCKEEMAGLYFSAMTAKEPPKYTETDRSLLSSPSFCYIDPLMGSVLLLQCFWSWDAYFDFIYHVPVFIDRILKTENSLHSHTILPPSGNFGGSLPLHYYNYLAEDMANCEATVITIVNIIIIFIIANIITIIFVVNIVL